nr:MULTISPECIES: DEAD/DEAH box helicase [unclassified Leptolyngbya]
MDNFQLQAIEALNAEKSVVVCAPTGSGKTLIGEYAILRALAHNEALAAAGSPERRRVFYTTPLKALSNQKLRDFRNAYGEDNVGLLTGDTSINRDAPILVMTTEIFRNMLYGTPIGQMGTSLEGLEAVVLDECHYMNDRQRGTVWEESIIYCPPQIQLVALSATIANSEQLTDWIRQVHGPTELIYSDYRPVPLEFHYVYPNGIVRLLNDTKTAINPSLKKRAKNNKGKNGKPQRQEAPTISSVVSRLAEADMLPAIYFIFSRRGCDRAVKDMGGRSLVSPAEAAQLKEHIDDFLARNPDANRAHQIDALYRGIAAHHAGILPAWKVLVEELFQRGLIKVVFATETLAAGINMPARTTVISGLSKRTDDGHRLLTASEFLQMAGRAGRRGMDIQGHVVTVQTPFEGSQEAAHLATVGPDPLVSQFTPSYGMVLNLLQIHTVDEARELIERSFGQYLATLHLQPQQQGILDVEREMDHQQAQIAHADLAQLQQFEKLNGRLKEERRLLKILQQQAMELQSRDLLLALPFAIAGTLLSLKGKNVPVHTPLAATLVAKIPGSGQFPNLICLSPDNRWHVVTVHDVVGLHAEIPRLAQADHLVPPPELPLKPGQSRSGDKASAAVAALIPDLSHTAESAPEVQEQQNLVDSLERELANHPVQQWGNPTQLLKRFHRLQRLEDELRDRRVKLSKHSQYYWKEFTKLMEILREFDGLHPSDADGRVFPTELGQIAAAIRGDNELWLGLALASGELDHLEPHQLAAACAALVTEVSRPDVWNAFNISIEVEEALEELRDIRRRLIRLQNRHQVALPVWLEYDFIALVEQWVLGDVWRQPTASEQAAIDPSSQTTPIHGVDWQQLCANTSLDEGDVVRVLRRTLDFLSQIPHVPHVSERLKRSAIAAIRSMDRFPVSESLT